MVQGIQFFRCQFEAGIFPEDVLHFGIRYTVHFLGKAFGCQFIQRKLMKQLVLAQFIVTFTVGTADTDTAVAMIGNDHYGSLAILTGKFEGSTASTVESQHIRGHADRIVRVGSPVDLAAFHH